MSETSASLPTRTVDGVEVPLPGTYALDVAHSHVGFMVRHMMVAKVRGRFTAFSGAVVVADDLASSTVEVEIDTASIDTRDETRDGHLRSPDFLDAEQYPTITFVTTGVTPVGGTEYTVHGDLTVHGVTRPVDLDVTYEGIAQDPWGNHRLGFTATTEIDREDFGLSWNQALETGGVLVGKAVKIEIEAEAVRQG
ncbi:MAG TPA: YceI family protein [Acidimicrobiales bacterium]